jgi:hypothetical protein
LTFGLTAAAQAASDAAAVRDSFYSLRTALQENRGDDAARHVSAATLAAVERARDLALYGTKPELEAQPTALLVAALSLRRSVAPQDLQRMPARDLVAYAVDNDLTRDRPVAAMDIGGVRVGQQTAVADLISKQPLPVNQLQFSKEDGLWKLDLSQIAYGDTAIDRVARTVSPGDAAGQRAVRTELVLVMLATQEGAAIDGSLWQPPYRRP